MSTKELREKAHKIVDSISDDKLPHFVSFMEEVRIALNKVDYLERTKQIIEEKRDLFRRLAQ
ncbi:MAG: hypothetical protein KF797_08440 [Flavobacteriales bacterium]|nr:hypothetical protein [Flavobacteriales bacterium]